MGEDVGEAIRHAGEGVVEGVLGDIPVMLSGEAHQFDHSLDAQPLLLLRLWLPAPCGDDKQSSSLGSGDDAPLDEPGECDGKGEDDGASTAAAAAEVTEDPFVSEATTDEESPADPIAWLCGCGKASSAAVPLRCSPSCAFLGGVHPARVASGVHADADGPSSASSTRPPHLGHVGSVTHRRAAPAAPALCAALHSARQLFGRVASGTACIMWPHRQ